MPDLTQIPVDHYEDKGQLQDRSRKIVVYTPELLPEQVAELAMNSMTAGWMVFRPNAQLQPGDIPTEDADIMPRGGSPSKELRQALWRLWDQRTDHSENFDRSYYPRKMREIRQQVLDKLN